MKKVLSVLLTVGLLFSLVGCGASSNPGDTVNAFCDALKAYDLETAATYIENNNMDFEDPLEEESEQFGAEELENYIKENAGKMTYVVGDAKVDGDKATVQVDFNYQDISPVMMAAIGEYFSQGMVLALSGADEESLENLITTIFLEKIKTVEPTTKKESVTFNCVKTDDGWKIAKFDESEEEKILNIATCNIEGALSGLEEDSDSTVDWDNEPNADDYTWKDAKLGQEINLGDLKVTVNGCKEVSELSAEYMEPDKAQDGTKYIVYDVTIENLTKEVINYDNEFKLVDNQDRSYNYYSDAAFYFDTIFMYDELPPSIPKNGNFVYNMPSDSTGYYLALYNDETKEAYRVKAN